MTKTFDSHGSAVVLNPDKCIGCDAPCQDVAPTDGPTRLKDGRLVIDYDNCTLCGGCVAACPFDNIEFSSERDDGTELLHMNADLLESIKAVPPPYLQKLIDGVPTNEIIKSLRLAGIISRHSKLVDGEKVITYTLNKYLLRYFGN